MVVWETMKGGAPAQTESLQGRALQVSRTASSVLRAKELTDEDASEAIKDVIGRTTGLLPRIDYRGRSSGSEPSGAASTAKEKRERNETGEVVERARLVRRWQGVEEGPKLIFHDDNAAAVQVWKTGRNPTMLHLERVHGTAICTMHQEACKEYVEIGPSG